MPSIKIRYVIQTPLTFPLRLYVWKEGEGRESFSLFFFPSIKIPAIKRTLDDGHFRTNALYRDACAMKKHKKLISLWSQSFTEKYLCFKSKLVRVERGIHVVLSWIGGRIPENWTVPPVGVWNSRVTGFSIKTQIGDGLPEEEKPLSGWVKLFHLSVFRDPVEVWNGDAGRTWGSDRRIPCTETANRCAWIKELSEKFVTPFEKSNFF